MNVLKDEDKFSQFLEIWPENYIREVAFDVGKKSVGSDWLALPGNLVSKLSGYGGYSDQILSRFANSKIEEVRTKLNRSHEKLMGFLRLNLVGYETPEYVEIITYVVCSDETSKKRAICESKFMSLWDDFLKAYYAFLDIAQKELSEAVPPTASSKKLITRDSRGDFLYNGELIKRKGAGAVDQDNIYFKVLMALIDESDVSGFLPYKKINSYLEKHGEETLVEEKQKQSRIDNALKGLWHNTTLKNHTPDGKKLIDRKRGKGLIFYNPAA